MLLYADEDFDFRIVVILRAVGHDVVTAQEDGRVATPDAGILAQAHVMGRCVLTHNRPDYERLHAQGAVHSGILSARQHHTDPAGMAIRIDAALSSMVPGRWCVRVNRPPPTP